MTTAAESVSYGLGGFLRDAESACDFVEVTSLVDDGLTILQEGLPVVIPVEMCYLDWQESLQQLANLVNPEIPDQ